MKQATDLKAAQAKARSLAQSASSSRAQASTPDLGHSSWHLALGSGTVSTQASNFKPFAKDPEKQRRYEEFLVHMKKGQKGGCWSGRVGSFTVRPLPHHRLHVKPHRSVVSLGPLGINSAKVSGPHSKNANM